MQNRTVRGAVDQFIHDLPALLEHIPAGEERLITGDRIHNELLVGVFRGEVFVEDRFHLLELVALPSLLDIEMDVDRLVRLDFDDDPILLEPAVLAGEEFGDFLEFDDDGGGFPGERLSGHEIDGDSVEIPCRYVELDRDERLGPTVGSDSFLLQVSVILSENDVPVEILAEIDASEDLELFADDGSGIEPGGAIHRHERKNLQEMVLEHIPEGSEAVVIASPASDSHVLAGGYLNVVDVLVIPNRLVDSVREAEGEDVLDRLLPDIVIDPVDVGLLEYFGDLLVEDPCGSEIGPERLLEDHLEIRAIDVLAVIDEIRELLRGNRKVEEDLGIRVLSGTQGFFKGKVVIEILQIQAEILHFFEERIETVFLPEETVGLLPHVFPIGYRIEIPPSEAEDVEIACRLLIRAEIEECRKKLPFGKISGASEYDEDRTHRLVW